MKPGIATPFGSKAPGARSFRTRDGRRVKVRLLWPRDAPLLVDFYARLSPETRWRRFHYAIDDADPAFVADAARRLADVDNRARGGAVIALETVAGQDHIVGVARLMRPENDFDGPEVEAAITIRDDYQQQGLGSELVKRLVPLAQRMKARIMVANIAADNGPALHVFYKLNLATEKSTTHGETTLRMTIPA